MKSAIYDQATIAYNSKDYPQALKLFYQCLKEEWGSFGPGDAGLVYHRIGNCLIKMRNFKEAAVSYQKALQDVDYNEKTSIYVNLGTTLNGIGKYNESIGYFNQALSDASYATPYRAHMGLGTAYTKLGKLVEAGIAYRDAALDEGNPNPIKALMSLGSTFTALGRPDDAAEAYLAVLDFRVTGAELNKTLDLLGQSYVTGGNYHDGLQVFEEALSHERFSLSPEGQEAFQKARTALGVAAATPVSAAPQALANDAAMEGAFEPSSYEQGAPYYEPEEYSGFDSQVRPGFDARNDSGVFDFNEDDGYGGGNVPNAGDTGFFTLSDADLIETGKRRQKKERKLKNTGLKIMLGIVIVLILILGGGVGAYMLGFGFPSQETVAKNFFTAYAADDTTAYTECWVDASSDEQMATFERLLDKVAKSDNIEIKGVKSGASESYALVDMTLPSSGVVHYRVDMVRELIGWKISGIEIVYASDYAAES